MIQEIPSIHKKFYDVECEKKIVLILIESKVNKILTAKPIPPEVKVASTVNLPVVISPMYLAPFHLMQTVAVVLWPT